MAHATVMRPLVHFGVLVSIVTGVALGMVAYRMHSGTDLLPNRLVGEAVRQIKANYVEEVADEQLANDALRGLPPELSAANLDNMIKQLQDRNIKVLLVGMLAPPNMGEDYAAAFNPIYGNLSEKYQVPLYPFFLDGVMTVEGMTLDDGMHPSPEGVDVMVAGILPMVERLIEELRPTP